MHKTTKLLVIILLTYSLRINAIEILYEEYFQSGVVSEDWQFYGDPISNINQDRGNPAPSFNNNGDAMYTSGVILDKAFSINDGIGLKVDNFFYCHPRGAWVSLIIGFFNINLEREINIDTPPRYIAKYELSFKGELHWDQPHLETVLNTNVRMGEVLSNSTIHANRFQNYWHTVTIELQSDSCMFFIDDSLISSYPMQIPDSLTEVGVFIGGRATSWGTALVDNLIVYRP